MRKYIQQTNTLGENEGFLLMHLTRSATWVIKTEMDDASGTVSRAADSIASSNSVSRIGAEFEDSMTATLDVGVRYQIGQRRQHRYMTGNHR